MLTSILSVSKEAKFTKGQFIINQGETGNSLFVVVKGSATVLIDGKDVAKKAVGDFFGEKGLLSAKPRTASIRADDDKVVAMEIEQKQFETLELRNCERLMHVLMKPHKVPRRASM